MDAGIADSLNRQIARRLARRLDTCDVVVGFNDTDLAWYKSGVGDVLMSDSPEDTSERAWIVGATLGRTTATNYFDWRSFPADGDWEMLFAHIRQEIQQRRDRDTHVTSAA